MSSPSLFQIEASHLNLGTRCRRGLVRSGSGNSLIFAGHFTMHLWAKAFMCFWLGFCLLWTIGAAVAVALQPDAPRFLPLAGMGMVAFGIALVAFAKSLSRDDVVWLSDVIKRALNSAA
jgi:hypothetical protein